LDLRLRRLHDVARRLRERRFPARADEHLGALARERARRLQADALAAAGDERRLARKPEVHRPNSCQRFPRLALRRIGKTIRIALCPSPGKFVPRIGCRFGLLEGAGTDSMPFVYDETQVEWPDDDPEPPPPRADQFVYIAPSEFGGGRAPVRFDVPPVQSPVQ